MSKCVFHNCGFHSEVRTTGGTHMIVTSENSPHFATPPEVLPQNDIWGMSAENSTLKMCHYPGLVSEATGGVAKY